MRTTALAATCLLAAVTLPATAGGANPAGDDRPPNIVLIYADDLGYGDIGCYGGSNVSTPHIDALATQGLRFTDGHAPAATCTPSRYALLTGEYAWRKPGTGILPGDAALIIEPGRTTLPAMLKQAGYTTGAVGKWHLGLGTGDLDWNGKIAPGPLEIGFDSAFILPATGDRVPCVYVEDHRVVGLDPADPIRVSYEGPVGDGPTGKENPELLKVHPSKGHDQTIVDGISRIGYMEGGQAARWKDEDMADVLTARATAFIERNKDRPFFLYYATHDIHVPRVPNPRFVGRTDLGPRGDVIAEFDWAVGEVLATLDRLGLAENTLVIVTSDNGPVVDDGYQDQAVERLDGHRPAGPLRGGKYSIYEGGTRVPFIVRWTGRVEPGVSDALVSQVDFLASLAALVGRDLPADAAPDSRNTLPALLGESREGRSQLVEQGGGVATALRQGPWKFIPGEVARRDRYADGPAAKGQAPAKRAAAKRQAPPAPALYNLAEDLDESENVAAQHPDRVEAMRAELERIRERGRERED